MLDPLSPLKDLHIDVISLDFWKFFLKSAWTSCTVHLLREEEDEVHPMATVSGIWQRFLWFYCIGLGFGRDWSTRASVWPIHWLMLFDRALTSTSFNETTAFHDETRATFESSPDSIPGWDIIFKCFTFYSFSLLFLCYVLYLFFLFFLNLEKS